MHASIIFSSVASSFAIVDLPLPLLPEIPIMLPFRTGIDTSEIIVSSPYENVTFSYGEETIISDVKNSSLQLQILIIYQ